MVCDINLLACFLVFCWKANLVLWLRKDVKLCLVSSTKAVDRIELTFHFAIHPFGRVEPAE